MAPHSDQAAGALQLCYLRGKLWKFVFIFAKPARPAFGALIDQPVRDKMIELGVVVNLAIFIPIVFAERATVIHDQCRRFRNSRLRKHLQNVLIKRRYGQCVFVAVESIDDVG